MTRVCEWEVKDEAKRSALQWKKFAVRAKTEKCGKIAHRMTKPVVPPYPVCDRGTPLGGDAAVESILQDFGQYWFDGLREEIPPGAWEEALAAGPQLPDITLHDFDRDCGEFADSAGLSLYCSSHKVWRNLSQPLKLRMLDILKCFECSAVLPALWTTIIFFIDRAS